MARGHNLRHITPDTPISVSVAKRLLIERDGLVCPDCGVLMWDPLWAIDDRGGYIGDTLDAKAEVTVDHLTPRSHGGLNVWGNFQLCCRSCNTRRYRRWTTGLAASGAGQVTR
jgi:5-methylcytosine-specific restriction endonuclease McrA